MSDIPKNINIGTLKVIAAFLRKGKHYHFARELRTIIGSIQGQFCSKDECESEARKHSQMIAQMKIAAAEKFKIGEKDHPDQSWESVNHLSELREELLDTYNYLEGLKSYNPSSQIDRIQKLIIDSYRLSGRLRRNPKGEGV